jgi:hypothetical protein
VNRYDAEALTILVCSLWSQWYPVSKVAIIDNRLLQITVLCNLRVHGWECLLMSELAT